MVSRAGRCHHSAACVQEADLDVGQAVHIVIDPVLVTVAPDCAAHPPIGRNRGSGLVPPDEPCVQGVPGIIAFCECYGPADRAGVAARTGGGAGVAIRHEEFYAGVAAGGEG